MKQLHFQGMFWAVFSFSFLGLGGCGMTAEELQGRIRNITPPPPGERMVASPDKTARQYPCSPQLGVILMVEKVEAVPVALMPGEEVNHHLQYAMCNPDPSRPVMGKIIRTLLFRGTPVLRDITPYEFKAGIWAVDAFIRIPASAESGVYAIETVLQGGPKTVRRVCSFTVKQKVAIK
jgi:hypothetical protein